MLLHMPIALEPSSCARRLVQSTTCSEVGVSLKPTTWRHTMPKSPLTHTIHISECTHSKSIPIILSIPDIIRNLQKKKEEKTKEKKLTLSS